MSQQTPFPEQEGNIAAANRDDEVDSTLGDDDVQSSTASISESILEYRAIKGRTYHSSRHPTEYFTPNDDRQAESVDLVHHYMTVLLDGKLFLAPIKDPKKVLDVGTGTGIWAIDFADAFSTAEVIGTDLSPMQPKWVPANLKFEIDDATLPWTWFDATFDFIHSRYLFGAIADWNKFFRQAYRVSAPGGWVESVEADCELLSDDGTIADHPAMAKWSQLFREAGVKTGRSCTLVADDVQRKAIEAAGFANVKVQTFKVPMGGWALDPKLAEVGRIVHAALENDMEGYTSQLWHGVLNWPAAEYQIFLMGLRKAVRNRKVHGYFTVRVVYGQKPKV